VVSLYAKGLTTGEIQAHLAEIYGAEVSRDTISKITDAVAAELDEWRDRPGLRRGHDQLHLRQDPRRRRGLAPGLRRGRHRPGR
jgi:hypothetical protein